jgi:amino acid transporter
MSNTITEGQSGLDLMAPDRLRGSLGVGSIVFMVVAAAAPLTVIAGTVPIGISLGDGAGYPAMYIICSIVLGLFAIGFTNMSRHVPSAGGFYAYIGRGLGRSAGLSAAFLALLSYIAVLVAVYGYIGAAINDLISAHSSMSLPWWTWSLIVAAVVSLLGYRQIDLSGKVLGVLLLGEVGVVLLIDSFVVGRGGHHGFSSAPLHLAAITSGAPGIAIMFALAGFLGFESTVVFRDEARNPARTIPRATYIALALIGCFYALSSWALVSAWGDKGAVSAAGANPGGMLAETARIYVGSYAADLVSVLLITSLFAAVLSFHNVSARYLFSLGKTSVLSRRLGRSHPKHSSPHHASVTVTMLTLLLIAGAVAAGLDPVAQVFAWLAGVATVGVVALMLATCLSVMIFFRRHRVDDRLWPTVVAPAIALVALAGCLYLTVDNLPLLVGGSNTLALVISAVLLLAVVLGPVVATLRPHANALAVEAT